MKTNDLQYIIYFTTNYTYFYKIENCNVKLIEKQQLFFNETLVSDEMLNKIRKTLEDFKQRYIGLNNTNVRIFATGIFQELSIEEKIQLTIDVFVRFGLLFNIIPIDLECFYRNVGNGDVVNGISKQEFRKVVICGSFQKNMKEIEDLMNLCNKHNIEVLSPWTKEIVPETIGTDFILLKGQELYNARDSWRHKYDHMQKFKKADAIIICNPDGRIGKGTMFEFGFMVAFHKRIIFTNEPEGLTIHFPYEVGIKIN